MSEATPGAAPRRRQGPGRVVVVISGKDGAGKSTVAANLASVVGSDLDLATALVDIDLQFGDQGMMFRTGTHPSLDDVITNMDGLSTEFVLECMHHRPGVSILTAPPTPERGELVNVVQFRAILEILQQRFDCIVLDVCSHFTDITLEAVEAADHLVLLTTGRLPSIKDSKALLRVLHDLGISRERVIAVINRVSETKLSAEVIADYISFPISADLPHAAGPLLDALTNSVPLVKHRPKSDFTKGITSLSRILLSSEPALNRPSTSPHPMTAQLGAEP
jgi:pilus assembly protein CpaE